MFLSVVAFKPEKFDGFILGLDFLYFFNVVAFKPERFEEI